MPNASVRTAEIDGGNESASTGATSAPQAISKRGRTSTTNRNIRGLIIEDNANERDQLEASLKRLGYQFVSAPTLQEADSLLANEKFDFILLDMKMPDGKGDTATLSNGFNMLEKISEADEPEIPIIVVTGCSGEDPNLEATCCAAKATRFLEKPGTTLSREIKLAIDGIRQGEEKKKFQDLRDKTLRIDKITNIITLCGVALPFHDSYFKFLKALAFKRETQGKNSYVTTQELAEIKRGQAGAFVMAIRKKIADFMKTEGIIVKGMEIIQNNKSEGYFLHPDIKVDISIHRPPSGENPSQRGANQNPLTD